MDDKKFDFQKTFRVSSKYFKNMSIDDLDENSSISSLSAEMREHVLSIYTKSILNVVNGFIKDEIISLINDDLDKVDWDHLAESVFFGSPKKRERHISGFRRKYFDLKKIKKKMVGELVYDTDRNVTVYVCNGYRNKLFKDTSNQDE